MLMERKSEDILTPERAFTSLTINKSAGKQAPTAPLSNNSKESGRLKISIEWREKEISLEKY